MLMRTANKDKLDISEPPMTAMSTLPGRMKECEQDRPGDRLTNVVDKCDNQSEEGEEKRVMGVQCEFGDGSSV